MATTVVTGRDCTVTFVDDSNVDIEAQAMTATLTRNVDRQRYETLAGPAYKTTSTAGTFEMTILADWGKSNSICDYVWGEMETDPDATHSMTFSPAAGTDFEFDVYFDWPSSGGTAPDAQEVSFTFTVTGDGDVDYNPES